MINNVLHFGRFHEEARDIEKGYSISIFRFASFRFDFLICIFRFVCFYLHSSILSFPNCNFRLVYSEVYVLNSIFWCFVFDLFFWSIFPRRVFSVVPDSYFFRLVFSQLYYSNYTYRFVFSYVFTSRLVTPRFVFHEVSFPIYILQMFCSIFFPTCMFRCVYVFTI